jgi:probable HAF family extracellular repeat protein
MIRFLRGVAMSIRKFLLAALLLTAAAADAQQLAYQMTLIPRLDYANGINDLGQIAGNGFNANGDIQAAVWTPGAPPSMRFLGTPPDFSGDINNAGQVTGQHQFGPGEYRAALFSNGRIQDLGAPGPSAGYAINAHGQVAGFLSISLGHDHAFLYTNGQLTDLGAFSGGHSDAYGINDAGQVVGSSLVAGVDGGPNTWRAFEYSSGALHELGIGGDFSIAWDINNAGQVVGEWRPSSENGSHAFVYKDGVVQDLGNLGGDSTYALSINDRGDIVGYGSTGLGPLHGFIYVDGKMVDLNTLLVAPDGWEITRTSAINEERQIASLACRIDDSSQCMPALLSPVPEPAAAMLWSGGLLLLAARWILRRPRAKPVRICAPPNGLT